MLMLGTVGPILSQEVKADGPVIYGFGHVWDVPNIDRAIDTNMIYKVVFDIHNSPESPDKLNPQINTLARFLNMHVRSGLPIENLKVVGVFHNKASKDLLQPEVYLNRYGHKNPNYQLITDLADAGVELIFCGQSSYSRDIAKEKIHPHAKLSLSAMTAILELTTQEGYTLIKF